MAQKSLSEVLRGGDFVKAADVVGQTFIVERYDVKTGSINGKPTEWPAIHALDAEGEPIEISGTGNMLRQLRAIDASPDFEFPLELKVGKFRTSQGGTGYSLEDPD